MPSPDGFVVLQARGRGAEHGVLGQVKVRLEEETGGTDNILVLHVGV